MVQRSLVSVVDDDESVRESLPDLLRQFGFAVQAFSSAEAFLASEFVSQTNCLILDIAMVGMSGPDLQQELTRRRQAIPIVFITAHGDNNCPSAPIGAGGRRVPVQAVQRRRVARGAHQSAWDEVNMRTVSTDPSATRPYTLSPPAQADEVEGRQMSDVTSIVFVVDDDVSVRESLELLIRTAGWQPETFASALEFLSRPRPTVPCCLVLDVTLPGLSGLELQQQLAERTDMPIIFITGHGDVPMTVQAMKAGAVEFLTKPFTNDVLLDAVGGAIERSRTAVRQESEMRVLRSSYASLTPREREVMALVVSGLLNKQVGGELGISEITVKAHRGQMMRKMKADSLPELVTMAARLGLRPARKV